MVNDTATLSHHLTSIPSSSLFIDESEVRDDFCIISKLWMKKKKNPICKVNTGVCISGK